MKIVLTILMFIISIIWGSFNIVPVFAEDYDFSLDSYTQDLLKEQNGGQNIDQNGVSVKDGNIITTYSKVIVEVKFIDNVTQNPLIFTSGNLLMCLGLTRSDCIVAQGVDSETNVMILNQSITESKGYFRLRNAQGKSLLKDNNFIYQLDWGSSPDQKIESNGVVTKNTLLVYMSFDRENEYYNIVDVRVKEKEQQTQIENPDDKIWNNLVYKLRGYISLGENKWFGSPKIILSNDKKVVMEELAIRQDDDRYYYELNLSDLEEGQNYSIIYETNGYISKWEVLKISSKSDLYVFTNKIRDIKLEYDKRNIVAPADVPWFLIIFLILLQGYIFVKIYKWINEVKNLQDY